MSLIALFIRLMRLVLLVFDKFVNLTVRPFDLGDKRQRWNSVLSCISPHLDGGLAA
jgi:hypothetical protein